MGMVSVVICMCDVKSESGYGLKSSSRQQMTSFPGVGMSGFRVWTVGMVEVTTLKPAWEVNQRGDVGVV